MKTLHLYLTRQMLATLGMTVFVFTCVLLLGNVIREILRLLVNHQVTIGVAAHAVLLLIPYVLAFSLPIGMLTAALLVFGRFSADQELTAARASGLSLISLVTPVLWLSVAVSVLCAWLNFDIAPAARTAYKRLIFEAALAHPTVALESGETLALGNHTVFAGKVLRDGSLQNVIVVEYGTNGSQEIIAQGATGSIATDTVRHLVIITLHDQQSYRHEATGWSPLLDKGDSTFPIPMDASPGALVVPVADMTVGQLCERLRQIEHDMGETGLVGRTTPQLRDAQRQLREIAASLTSPALVYLHRAVAFSFACIGFTLVGIPLGVRAHRRETSVGVAVALVLMLVYYSFIVLAQAWESHPERAPQLIVWLPNFIFEAAGIVLLWRANRGI